MSLLRIKIHYKPRFLGAGLEFADALHLAASKQCTAFVTFDDRKFARRAQQLNLVPSCETPK